MSKEKKKPSIEYDYDETYVMCNQYVWCVIHMYMVGDFVMESTEVFDFAESMKSQINVHTGTLYISCIPLISTSQSAQLQDLSFWHLKLWFHY